MADWDASLPQVERKEYPLTLPLPSRASVKNCPTRATILRGFGEG
jgi:hypothetical protein